MESPNKSEKEENQSEVVKPAEVQKNIRELPKATTNKKTVGPLSTKKRGRIARIFLQTFSSVTLQDKVNFARHLAVCIKSGMPILEGLRLISEQSESKSFNKILNSVMEDVNNGLFLAQSLQKFDYIFGDFFINLVKVGETSGNLSSTLIYLSQELKKQREINNRVRGAMIYPAVIFFATVGITLFLTLYIFPKILPIFTSLKIQLPFTTRALIAALNFLRGYGLITLLGIAFVVILVRFLLSVRKIHYYFDRLILSVPVVSRLIRDLTLANFTRSLSVLLKSGMTLLDALAIAKGTFHNLYYQKEIEHVAEAVSRGESIAKHISKETKLFPPMLVGMIRVGEGTGNLEENLIYLSEYYEGEVDESVKNLTTVLEPVLLLMMGIIVAFIALSMITPIYSITQGLKTK